MALGNKYKGFSGSETWVNVLEWESVRDFMADRISQMGKAGCDAVELDNIDWYACVFL